MNVFFTFKFEFSEEDLVVDLADVESEGCHDPQNI